MTKNDNGSLEILGRLVSSLLNPRQQEAVSGAAAKDPTVEQSLNALTRVAAKSPSSVAGSAASTTTAKSIQSLVSAAIGSSGANTTAAAVPSLTNVVRALLPSTATQSATSGPSTWISAANPLIGGLLSLFGSNDGQSSEQPLLKFALPQKQRYEAAFNGRSGGAVASADYGQMGISRPAAANADNTTTVVAPETASNWLSEHGQEIAEVVKRALLESGGLPELLKDI